jgi:hypothetical protein
MLGTRLVHHGLVHVRIEVGAHRFERPYLVLAEQIVQLRVNQLDAFAVRSRFRTRIDRQRAIEVVDDEQQILEQIDDRLVGLLAAFAVDAAAVAGPGCAGSSGALSAISA